MSFNQTIIFGAGVLMVAAVAAPSVLGTPEQAQRPDSANITRADDAPKTGEKPKPVKRTLFGSGGKNVAKSPRSRASGCDHNGDFAARYNPCHSSNKRNRVARVAPGKIKRSAGGRSVTVDADKSGQFKINARMNGRRVPVLVDTGATSVAVNVKTARRLGITLTDADFKHEAQTANGVTKFARTTIREIRIGGIVVDNVDAAVLSNASLSNTLLGASFLKRLSKYSVENGALKMTQ